MYTYNARVCARVQPSQGTESRVLRDDDENASRFCRPTLHLLARQTDTQPKM